MMRAAKQDANHKEIREAARKMGVGWFDCFQLKKFCDAFIVCNGFTIAVEVKDGSKPPSAQKLTEGEIEFRDEWQLHGGKYAVIRDLNDLTALITYYKHYKEQLN